MLDIPKVVTKLILSLVANKPIIPLVKRETL